MAVLRAAALLLTTASMSPAATLHPESADAAPPLRCDLGDLILYRAVLGAPASEQHLWELADRNTIAVDVPKFEPFWDNEVSAWCNRTGRNYCVSDGYYGGNPDNTMPDNTWGNFTTTGWNDRASSLGYINCP